MKIDHRSCQNPICPGCDEPLSINAAATSATCTGCSAEITIVEMSGGTDAKDVIKLAEATSTLMGLTQGKISATSYKRGGRTYFLLTK